MLIDAINSKSMEFIDRPHPFGVALREIIIYCNNMYTSSGQRIKENRKSSYYSFSFTCSHLCNFPFVKSYTSNKLNIIMNHVPGNLITSCNPLIAPNCFVTFNSYAFSGGSQISVILSCRYFKYAILFESFCSFFNYCKSSWYKLIKCYFNLLIDLFFNFIYSIINLFFQ